MADIMHSPEWLNKDFFQHSLNENFDSKSEIKVLDFEILPGLQAGISFCSNAYRICVSFKTKRNKIEQIFVFVKSPTDEGLLKHLVKEGKFIEKEWKMYNELFPEIHKLNKNVDIIPLHYPSKHKDTLVLEDLGNFGYKMCDKHTKLDFEHVSVTMATLAKFHACSVAVHNRHPELVESLGVHHIFEFEQNFGHIFVGERLNIFIENVEIWKGFERFGNMIRQISNTFSERLQEMFSRRKTLNVLNHGDAWLGNILFKYDEQGSITAAKLIDFQICIYGTIGLDLNHFIWTSVQDDVRAHRLDELHSVYLNTLNSYLAHLGCKQRMSREQFQEEIKFTMFYTLVTIMVFSYILFTPDDGNKEDETKSVYDKRGFRSNAEQGLIYLEKNGFFK